MNDLLFPPDRSLQMFNPAIETRLNEQILAKHLISKVVGQQMFNPETGLNEQTSHQQGGQQTDLWFCSQIPNIWERKKPT